MIWAKVRGELIYLSQVKLVTMILVMRKQLEVKLHKTMMIILMLDLKKIPGFTKIYK